MAFTLSIAYYQRTTGPTYPVTGKMTISGKEISFRFPTSNESTTPAKIIIRGDLNGLNAEVRYKKHKVDEHPKNVIFRADNDGLTAELPPEPPAGKLEYNVAVSNGGEKIILNDKPVVIRFKGPVPLYILIPHVIFMFAAMLFSTRTGIEALRKGPKMKSLSGMTLAFLGLGGMILGPVVQKYAFGEFWTGWPFGNDLTDNKTLTAFAAWLVAWIRIRKNGAGRAWAVAAAIILIAVYLIPHSMFGSELDYESGKIETG